jgi:hypothetical protein
MGGRSASRAGAGRRLIAPGNTSGNAPTWGVGSSCARIVPMCQAGVRMRLRLSTAAALGATTSLVAAVGCTFLVAASVLAFHGWPADSPSAAISSLRVQDSPLSPRPAAAAPSGVPAVVLPAAVAPTRVAPAGAAPAGAGPAAPVTSVAPRPRPPASTSTPSAAAVSSPASPVAVPGPPSPAVPSLGQAAAQTVTNTTDALGRSVGGLSSGLGQTVRDTGRALGSTLASQLPAPARGG